ncbi:MAG TPA: sigma-70 family RNA polymerase sigma factor [Nitrosomonas sp.]|nr:sigma-70 family RNA polymerase sigma factor [Nitrosomonas sp.]
MDESALLRAAKTLDKDGLTIIFDMYAPAIYKYALRLCRDPIKADNIVGDVFSQLLEQCARGKGPVTNLRSYLFQIAYHLIVDQTRHYHHLVDLEVVPESIIPITSSSQYQVEERVLLDALVSALNSELNEIQRHVITLRFLEGFSLKETALVVGKKVNSVKVIQNRGVARLRKCLRLDFENSEPDPSITSDGY